MKSSIPMSLVVIIMALVVDVGVTYSGTGNIEIFFSVTEDIEH